MQQATDGVSRARRSIGTLIRLLPGGAALLRFRRRGIAAARRRVHPIRPPVDSPERVAELSRTPNHPFITGNGLAARCRYVINYDDLKVNDDVDNDWWFCRTDFIEYFFAEHEPTDDFVLFSHNSDRPVDHGLTRFLRRRRLRAWFATNVVDYQPRLHVFPLGIANPRWRHGNAEAIMRVQGEQVAKSTLFDASYDVSTFPPARDYCRAQTGIEPAPRRGFEEYLRDLASAYFCIAPRGHGIDTHRIWEALYLHTVPIVTRSVLTDQHVDLPMIVLDDWSEFRNVLFSPELYERTWGAWRPSDLHLDSYLARIRHVLDR